MTLHIGCPLRPPFVGGSLVTDPPWVALLSEASSPSVRGRQPRHLSIAACSAAGPSGAGAVLLILRPP